METFDLNGEVLWNLCKLGDSEGLREALALPEVLKSIEWQDQILGTTPLLASCIHGHRSCVNMLLNAGANINARDSMNLGNSCLHYAVFKNHVEIVNDLLLRNECDLFILNNNAHSALDLARFRENASAQILHEKFLVFSGNVEVKNANGILSPWHSRRLVVLRNSVDSSIFELCVCQHGEKFKPRYFSLYYPRKDEITTDRAKKRSFIFSFPIFWKKFSNSEKSGFSRKMDATSTNLKQFIFSVDNPHSFDKWISILSSLKRNSKPPSISPMSPPLVGFDQSPLSISSVHYDASPPYPSQNSLHAPPPYSSLSPPLETAPPVYSPSLLSKGCKSKDENSAVSSEDLSVANISLSTNAPSKPPNDECIICYEKKRAAVAIPCGHISSCYDCMDDLHKKKKGCPICRQDVQSVVQVYYS